MSKGFQDKAWQHIEKAQSQFDRAQYSDALATLAKAEQLARKAQAQNVLSAVLETKASVLQSKGMFDEALKLHTAALNIQEKLAKIDPFFNTWVATTLNNLGNLLKDMGRLEEAKKSSEHALEINEILLKTDPHSSVYQLWVATTLNNLGTLLSDMGRLEEAKKSYERALEIYKTLLETAPENSEYRSNVSMTFSNLGNLLSDMGRLEEAKKSYECALDIYETLLETDPENNAYQSHISMAFNNLGNLLSDMGRLEEAKQCSERSLEMRETLLETDPQSSVYQSDVAMTLNNLGNLLFDMGRQEEAKTKYERAIKLREALLETDPQNSVYQSNVAMTLNNLSNLLSDMGSPAEAKKSSERSLEIYETLLVTDPQSSIYQSDVAMTLNNLGNLLINMAKPEVTKARYERALEMRETLLATDPQSSIYQSWVATTLNNLGAMLKNMGRPEDAKKKYERTLEIYEALLKTDSGSSVYQSQVSMALNNLGNLLKNMGNKEKALSCYQKSLGVYTEPMQYLTIKAKARAIINIIQLVSGCAQEETNTMRKSKYFNKIHAVYKQHDDFFSRSELMHERRLVKEAGLSAHIQYLMLNARSEEDKEKRIAEYEKCIQEIEQIVEAEDDGKLKGLLTSIRYYLKGRQFVNMAMLSETPDTELMKKAIAQFKLAKDRYAQGNVCYCIYTVLLELENTEVLDDEAVLIMKKLLKHALESLPEKMDDTVKSAFHEIEELLDSRNLKTDPEMFERLNKCITKIDYYALREHFSHISCKIRAYLEEPFNPKVEYSNWGLHVTFDEPEKVQGKLTIKAGDRVVFNEPLQKRNRIDIKYIPEVKDETITFVTENNRNVTRPITHSEEINHDNGYRDVHFLGHDCKQSITGTKLNIAIVQLKYKLKKAGSTLIIEDNDAYSAKLTQILDAVKGKADIIVFPEFSIPVRHLPEMKQYSDENGTIIVAGSHYITDETLGEYNDIFYHGFDDNDDLRKNISPVIIPFSDKIHHTEKILPAKEERKLFNNEGMTHGSLNRIFKLNNNVTFGVMICFDFINDDLRKRITDACDVILVPQANPGTKRFHKTGHIEIDNPRNAGNKAYIMASAIFTYNDKEDMMGGDSGIIMTLDKESYKNRKDAIIETIIVDENKVYEQFIQMAQLNMKFNAARDTQTGQVPITYNLIHIFEQNEMLEPAKDGKKDDRNPQAFLELLKTINSCEDRHKLKQLLAENGKLIRKHSPLMHKTLIQTPSEYKKDKKGVWNAKTNTDKIIYNLTSLKLDEIKGKCAHIVLN